MTKKKAPSIAITGASGFVGTTLVDYFAEKDWHVIALVRHVPHQKKHRKNIEYREYDIAKPVKKSNLAGADYLVHAAYIKLSKENPNAFQLNVEGARNIIAASHTANVRQAVFISTMSAHEDAISIYGKQKLAIEKLFLDSPHSTVLRCGLIVGDGGIVRDMANFMRSKHMVPLIGGGNQPLQVISVYDLCAVIASATTNHISGRFVTANPTIYTYRQFYHILARYLGIKVIFVPAPYWLLQLVFKIAILLHLHLDIGEDNLKGLRRLKAMPSSEDMKTLKVTTLSLEESLKIMS